MKRALLIMTLCIMPSLLWASDNNDQLQNLFNGDKNISAVEWLVGAQMTDLRRTLNLTEDQAKAIRPIYEDYYNQFENLKNKNMQDLMEGKVTRPPDHLDDQRMQRVYKILAPDQINLLLIQKMKQNEVQAKLFLRAVSTNLDIYKESHNVSYPSNVADLGEPNINGYMFRNDCGLNEFGYSFTCDLSPNGYTIQAKPLIRGTTGRKTYTVKTGSVWSSS